MAKKLSFFILLMSMVLLIIPLTSAIDMQVTFTAAPGNNIRLNVLNPDSLEAYQVLMNDTDSNGQITFPVSVGVSKVTFSAILYSSSGKILASKTFGNYTSGGSISLNFLETPATPAVVNVTNTSNSVANATVNSTVNLGNQSLTNNSSLEGNRTGFTIASLMGAIPRWGYGILWAIVGLVILWLVYMILRKTVNLEAMFESRRMYKKSKESVKEEAKEDESDKTIDELERNIKDLKTEVDILRDKKKAVHDAERKVQEAQRQLEKIRKNI